MPEEQLTPSKLKGNRTKASMQQILCAEIFVVPTEKFDHHNQKGIFSLYNPVAAQKVGL